MHQFNALTSHLTNLIRFDKKDFFATPVTDEIATDYRDIIKEPMAFSVMIDKLSSHSYSNVEEFEVSLTFFSESTGCSKDDHVFMWHFYHPSIA